MTRTLSLEDAAAMLLTTTDTVSEAIRTEGLPAVRIGRAYVLIDEDVIAWVHADEAKAGKDLSVPLNDDALAVLREQRGRHRDWVFPVKRWTQVDGVWAVEMGPTGKASNHAWRKACMRAGVPELRWHDLRHTWASWHVQAGTPLAVLQELGGWASYSMVLRYSHLAPGHVASWAGNVSAPTPRKKPKPSGGATSNVHRMFPEIHDDFDLEPLATGFRTR